MRADESGAVTAETAMVIPVLVLLTTVMAWIVSYGVTQVRAVDAARETARALARGDDPAASEALGRKVAPPGATFSVRELDGEVEVTVRSRVRGPAGLFGLIPGGTVEARAVTVQEPGP